MAALLALLANKLFWQIAGPLAIAAAIYFKAYRTGKASEEAEQAKADRAFQTQLRAAEAKNQFIEQKREEQNDEVDSNSGSIDSLIGVFNKIQSEQTADSDSDTKTK